MAVKKKRILAAALIVCLMTFQGCALLQAPFKLVGHVLRIVDKLPKPPPGVF